MSLASFGRARTAADACVAGSPYQYGLGMPDLASLVAATPVLERPTLVAVDGVDGSGKTTFAERLATAYTDRGRAVQVVHMDDFLNPRSVRYRMGRTSPEAFFSETYDLVAFTTKVHPLRPGADHAITLRAFDHRTDKPLDDESVEVPPQAVVLIGGHVSAPRRTLQLVGHVHLLGRAVLSHGPAHGSARWRSPGRRAPLMAQVPAGPTSLPLGMRANRPSDIRDRQLLSRPASDHRHVRTFRMLNPQRGGCWSGTWENTPGPNRSVR